MTATASPDADAHGASQLDDCFLHDKDRLAHGDAIRLLSERVRPVGRHSELPLAEAAGRISACLVKADAPVPQHRNAAVDGYAFASAGYDGESGTQMTIVGRAAAGHPHTTPVAAGTAIRIFTGAAVPDTLDSVAMQEDVTLVGDTASGWVRFPAGLKPGANVRLAGEDLEAGDAVVTPGQRLRPQDIAGLASIGAETVRCFARPRIALYSTGDEVVRAGAPLAFGQVYDANAPMLAGLAAAAGATLDDLGVLPDDAGIIAERLSEAARAYDLVITTGGASRGEEDHVVTVLDRLGKRHLWQIAVKPGRPMSFGQIGDTLFMGFPGNPVAAFVCFVLYGRLIVTRLAGGVWQEPPRFRVPAAFEIPRKKPDRREFLRGRLVQDGGALAVEKFPRDGSGLISSLRASDGLIELSESVTGVRRGDPVNFIPYSAFGIG